MPSPLCRQQGLEVEKQTLWFPFRKGHSNLLEVGSNTCHFLGTQTPEPGCGVFRARGKLPPGPRLCEETTVSRGALPGPGEAQVPGG